jgi:mannose-6-phosphate isomerase-like protein (cupin superfamily)
MNTVRISEITETTGWAPLREHLDAQAFGINAWTATDPGDDLVREHDERRSGHEELYLVVAGRATFTVDGEELDAPQGTAILVAPESRRGAVAAEAGTTVVVVGAKPGEAFRPRSWETNLHVIRLLGEGRVEEARELLRGALGRFEEWHALEYNLACCEAKLGNADVAFEHLRKSLDGRPDLVEIAQGDDDLDAIRDDPRFGELVGAATPRG